MNSVLARTETLIAAAQQIVNLIPDAGFADRALNVAGQNAKLRHSASRGHPSV
jgi:hypothetical protein